jgi:predicted RNA-binding Zn ribbon-like protein
MSNPAPDQLELVRSFVNTYDHEDGTEKLANPAALTDWLEENGLGAPRATTAELERTRELREALRAILQHHGGLELDPAAPRVVDEAAARAKLSVAFDDHGDARIEPKAGGVDGALGRLLVTIADAQRDGTWSRLKACPAEDCQYAFYDRSRNRSAVWCDMKVCGNRNKVRSFRTRHTHA